MITKKPSKKAMQVTFELPADAANDKAAVVGDFNDWDPKADPMKFVKSRKVWSAKVKLEKDKQYQFRYYVDGSEWKNDPDADAYVGNEYFGENCVIDTSKA